MMKKVCKSAIKMTILICLGLTLWNVMKVTQSHASHSQPKASGVGPNQVTRVEDPAQDQNDAKNINSTKHEKQDIVKAAQRNAAHLDFAKNLSDNASFSKPLQRANVIKDLAVADYRTVNLSNLRPTVKICIHNIGLDKWISDAIARGDFWEGGNVKLFQAMLRSDPELHAIDIGANIGQYSLIAAHMGRKVLAVEARKLHVHMLYRSLQLNGFLDRVTLVHNAISDTYTQVQLGTYKDNQGGTYIRKSNASKSSEPRNVKDDMAATTILMDDLAPVANFTKAVLKIDIEGYEDRAFKYSQKLFKKVFIPLIMAEWTAMKKKPAKTIEPLLKWLLQEGYEPYTNKNPKLVLLDVKDWQTWTFDVVFKHKSVTIW